MDMLRFKFNDIDSLVISKNDLNRMYPHLCIMSDNTSLILSVEISDSWSFDTKVIAIIEKRGGKLMK